jgi:diaminohydroxyphosphoribosylaminopyrimidine deaminase/5-amino-6-(5-phosphoribosylamino)uracil reductase
MDYMLDAIDMARSALGKVSPNPAVGAVLVKDGVVVGKGCTQLPGSDHAEKVALKAAGTQARGATMYVTLEPCCHFGRTPPCTSAIIEANVAEVHMAILDPNPLVSGKGQAELEAAGIKTYVGEHRDIAERIMEAYIKHITSKRPFVTAKYAMSLDGKIATASGDSKWISGEASRQQVQRIRYEADAVMVGVGTVLADNPRLSLRIGEDEVRDSKLRVIVDTRGRTPPDAQLFKEPGKVLIATTDSIGGDREHQYKELGAEVLKLPDIDGMVDLDALMQALGTMNITSVIAEGGGTVLGSLFDQGLVDKVAIFIAPKIIGGADSQTPVAGGGIMKMEDVLRLRDINIETFEQDLLITGYIKE